MEWKARVLPVTVAIVCLGVALTWPGWREALAQSAGYNYLGCTTQSGDFVPTVSQGPNSPDLSDPLIITCADAANDVLGGKCIVLAETLVVVPKSGIFGTLLRYWCPIP